MLGKLKVGGRTTGDVSDEVIKALEPYLKDPTVVVRIVNYRVTLMGEVARPGVYQVPNEKISIQALERVLIPTGLFMELPVGYEAQVRPRSGLAYKKGVGVVNSPGTIDADYRGEIKVIIINLSNEELVIEDGERIAQMVIAKHERAEWEQVDSLSETDRGAGGFGSTGKK